MDIYEFSKQITNREYLWEVSREEAKWAKDHDIVVVLGRSDDLAEFRGAIEDEVDCYGGGIVYDNGNEFIEAVWCKGGYTWSYETNIPHATFDIYDEGEKYCKGIVFDINDKNKPLIPINETFIAEESQYRMPYSELSDIVAFVRNHEWDDIPESIKGHLEEWEEFLVDNL